MSRNNSRNEFFDWIMKVLGGALIGAILGPIIGIILAFLIGLWIS